VTVTITTTLLRLVDEMKFFQSAAVLILLVVTLALPCSAGVIWSSKYTQFGVEAIVPINERTGHSVGVIGQVHFYLDDLFPRSLGRPLFGYV